jgi:hypothetical protein
MTAAPSPDDDRVDPSDPRFRTAVAEIAARYFSEAAVKTRHDVARELELAGLDAAARYVRKRAKEIEAQLPVRQRPGGEQ